MVALLLAAVLASQPAPARTAGRVAVTIMAGAEIHFNRVENRPGDHLERSSVRGDDGIRRPALLVEFE